MKQRIYTAKGVFLNLDTVELYVCGERVRMPHSQLRLMAVLMRRQDLIFSPPQLVADADLACRGPRSVHMLVGRTRRKIAASGIRGADRMIETHYAVGYRFNPRWYAE